MTVPAAVVAARNLGHNPVYHHPRGYLTSSRTWQCDRCGMWAAQDQAGGVTGDATTQPCTGGRGAVNACNRESQSKRDKRIRDAKQVTP